MGGLISCFATDCTDGMTLGDFGVGLLVASAIVAGIVLLVKWLIPDDKDKGAS